MISTHKLEFMAESGVNKIALVDVGK